MTLTSLGTYKLDKSSLNLKFERKKEIHANFYSKGVKLLNSPFKKKEPPYLHLLVVPDLLLLILPVHLLPQVLLVLHPSTRDYSLIQ